MSDMKIYDEDYSYEGVRGRKINGVREVTVKWFVYGDMYYKPEKPLKIILTDQPEEGGWILAECEAAGITIGGNNTEEVLGNAFMMAVDQYEVLGSTELTLSRASRKMRDTFRRWEVHSVGSVAQ